MIQSFKHLKRLYQKGNRAQVGQMADKAERILTVLDAADDPQALNLPGFGLHALKGNLKGFWSVTVQGNWRIIFRLERGDAYDVDLIDYH